MRPSRKTTNFPKEKKKYCRWKYFHKDEYLLVKKLLFNKINGFCILCLKPMQLNPEDPFQEDAATIDHIIPLSTGGKSEKSNMRVICYKCNSTRNSK